MIVFTDLISGDQVLSDSHPQKPLTFNDAVVPGVFTVQAHLKVKGPVDVNTGANASTEEQEDGVDDVAVKVVDLKDPELGFGYEGPQTYSEAEFGVLYKGWCKAVKEAIEAEGKKKPKEFMQAAKAFLDFYKANFSSLEIYHPKSFNGATFVLGFWDDEANEIGAPKFIFFADALKAEKY